jgi:hypothetical protein
VTRVRFFALPQSGAHPNLPKPGNSLGATQTLSPHNGSLHAGVMNPLSHARSSSTLASRAEPGCSDDKMDVTQA